MDTSGLTSVLQNLQGGNVGDVGAKIKAQYPGQVADNVPNDILGAALLNRFPALSPYGNANTGLSAINQYLNAQKTSATLPFDIKKAQNEATASQYNPAKAAAEAAVAQQGIINPKTGVSAAQQSAGVATVLSQSQQDAYQRGLVMMRATDAAKRMVDLINKHNKGQIGDTAFNAQKNALASEQIANLTPIAGDKRFGDVKQESLQGMMPTYTQYRPGLVQRAGTFFAGGNIPVNSNQLQETDDQLKAKALATIQTFGTPEDIKKYNFGKATLPAISQQGGWNGFHGNPVGNLANDVVGTVKGAAQYLTTEHPGQTLNPFSSKGPVAAAAAQLPEIGKSAARTAGFGVKPDGSISWSPVDIARHAWNQPLETLAWLAPLKGKLIGETGGATLPEIGATTEEGLLQKAAQAGKRGIEKTLEVTEGGGTKKLIAQNVLKDQAASLDKTLLDHNIYKVTDKARIEATQRALVDEGSMLAKKYAASKATINTNVLDKQVDQILRSNGVADQATATQIKSVLGSAGVYDLPSNSSDIPAYQVWDMAKKADEFGPKAFNIPNIGPQAKAITSDIARYLRGYLSEKVPEATPNLRSYANLRTYMDDILPDPKGVKLKGAMSIMNFMANVGNALIEKPLQMVAQKTYNQLNKFAPEAQEAMPSATINPPGTLPPIPQGTTRRPLQGSEGAVLPQIIEGKGPAQAERLVRDMRYKQGNFMTRGEQEKFIRSAAKKKYR